MNFISKTMVCVVLLTCTEPVFDADITINKNVSSESLKYKFYETNIILILLLLNKTVNNM